MACYIFFQKSRFNYHNAPPTHHKIFKTALNDCFVDITNIHSHNTRTKENLVYFKPRVQTSTGKKSLTYRGIDLWGKIKPESKELSWVSLKKKMKQKAIQNYNASP